jgi:sugar-specific transcriptional regulator TrmB
MESHLEQLGLSKGEVKVYLALFNLKEGTKYSIAKEAEVSASKVYEILDKLIKKGLVSTILRNNVKHFLPANPAKLKEYVEAKKEAISKEEKIVANLLPMLSAKLKSDEEKTKVQLFEGVEGMRSVLSILENELNSKHEWVAMGIRSDKKSFFNNIMLHFQTKRAKKSVPARMLFADKGSNFYMTLKQMNKTQIKVLSQITPAGVAVYRNHIAIFYYGEKPSFVFITNEGIAQSFREFFNGLWEIAKK